MAIIIWKESMASISTSLTKNKSQSRNNSRGTETCQYERHLMHFVLASIRVLRWRCGSKTYSTYRFNMVVFRKFRGISFSHTFANVQPGNVPCKFSTNVFCIIRSMLAHSHLTVYGVMCVFGTAYFLLRRQHKNH